MLKISEMVNIAKQHGYNEANAEAKVCQDIILSLVSRSNFDKNITVKGGVVMRSISNDARRATQDIDLDFIRYSLGDESVRAFIQRLNSVGEVSIKITGPIEELKQQDYHGKRVNIEISDEDQTILNTKIDLGVHKQLDIAQEEFCFDVGTDDEGVCLLINSKEQMLTEKLRSILKFGSFSTRYKDIFDIYYLSKLVNFKKLNECFKTLIYDDEGLRENYRVGYLDEKPKMCISNVLYQKYVEWCEQEGCEHEEFNRFGRLMTQCGVERRRTSLGTVYLLFSDENKDYMFT
jgi:predicted nucleotidyltransferase component of viral defense system